MKNYRIISLMTLVFILVACSPYRYSYKNEHLTKNENDYTLRLPAKTWSLRINNMKGELNTYYYSKFQFIEIYHKNWYFQLRYSTESQYKIKYPMTFFWKKTSNIYRAECYGESKDYKYLPSFIFKGKNDSCYVADYFQPEWDKMGIRARKLIAIMEYDGVIMDIEISKIFYQDSDAAEFQRILNSIEFVEIKQEE